MDSVFYWGGMIYEAGAEIAGLIESEILVEADPARIDEAVEFLLAEGQIQPAIIV